MQGGGTKSVCWAWVSVGPMERFDQFSILKNNFENQTFEMFEELVHNFGKSDVDMI